MQPISGSFQKWNANMIHVAIGTKAQFIKMAPIMVALQEKGIGFNLIDLGQHSMTTRNLREELGLKSPNVTLSSGKTLRGLGRASDGFRDY